MLDGIIIYFFFPLSVIIISLLIWYVRKLLSIIEDRSLEIRDRFSSFHLFLEETYKMDLFYGEPRLKELLTIIKEFDEWSREFQNRIIVENDDRTEED